LIFFSARSRQARQAFPTGFSLLRPPGNCALQYDQDKAIQLVFSTKTMLLITVQHYSVCLSFKL